MQKKKSSPKKPSDYRTLQIRVPPERITWYEALDKKIDAVRLLKNKDLPPDEKRWMKNHVLIEAVEIGLKEMKKGT